MRIALKHRVDGRLFDVTGKNEVLIGSATECDIRLDEGGVAPKHARVRISRVGIELDDLAGNSSTAVNSYATNKHFLSRDDEIRLGAVVLTLDLDPSEAPPGPKCRRCGAEVPKEALTEASTAYCEYCTDKRGSSRFRRVETTRRSPSGRFPAQSEKIPLLNADSSTARFNVNQLAVTDVLNDFAVLAVLGEGSQGRVYKLQNRASGLIVAGKLLWTSSKKARARFDREIEALKLLQHPAIVSIVEVRENSSAIVLLMEYVNGPSLSAILKKQARLEAPRALALAAQLADGLAFAASKGVIHRDVKASNVLIGPNDTAKLVDFGLVAFEDARTKLTADGQWIGTPHYMSPEQMAGAEVEARTDLWGLGVTFYQAITGALPFDSQVPADLFKKVMNDPVDLGNLEALVGAEAAALLGRCLAKNPEDRPQPAEVAQGLARLVASG